MIAGILLIAGSIIFLVGAAIGVPGVFMEPDLDERLRLLTAHPAAWQIAQPLYGIGPLVAAAGVGVLAFDANHLMARIAFGATCASLALGSLAWGWSLFLRATRVADFAAGELPGWPFAVYVLLTIGGLLLLGVGLLAGGFPAWSGWLTLGATVVFLAGFLWFRDIPPFVFYLLLLPIGVAVMIRRG